jgi:hypothetical protein
VKRNRNKGKAKLTIRVQAPGTLRLAETKLLRRTSRQAPGAGKVSIPVRPTKRAAKLLRRRGHAQATAKVTFAPTGGEPRTKRTRVKLVRR